jgi:hypothetical protein
MYLFALDGTVLGGAQPGVLVDVDPSGLVYTSSQHDKIYVHASGDVPGESQ